MRTSSILMYCFLFVVGGIVTAMTGAGFKSSPTLMAGGGLIVAGIAGYLYHNLRK